MNFGKFDIILLTTCLLAVILMTLTFPMIGLAGDDVEEDDVPEFNVSADRFDFAGEFPENPGSPSEFYLHWNDQLGGDSDNVRWLDGDVEAGHEILVTDQTGTQADPQADVIINHWDEGSVIEDEQFTLNFTEHERVQDFGEGYDLFVQFDRKENISWDDGASEGVDVRVKVEVRDQPDESGWLSRLPIIGSVLGAGDALASMVGWIGSVIWWTVTWFFSISLNLLGLLLDVVTFVIDLTWFIISTYIEIMASDTGTFAGLVITVPMVLFMLSMTKLVMVAISLLPTT